eukprot:Gb_14252 [translate_table: standard]
MPKVSNVVRQDLNSIRAWWYFKDATIVRVEGTLIPPTALPTYVHERLIALDVARQCFYGVAGKCKGGESLSTHPRESWGGLLSPNFRGGPILLVPKKLERGYDDQEETAESPIPPTPLSFDSSVAGSSSLGSSVVVTPSIATSLVFKVPPQGGVFSSIAPPLSSPPTLFSPLVATSLLDRSASTSFKTLIHHISTTTPITSSLVTTPPTIPLFFIPISPILSSLILSTPSLFTSFSQSTLLTTKVYTTVPPVSIPTSALSISPSLPYTTTVSKGEEASKRSEIEVILPLDLSNGIKASPLISIKLSLWGSPTFTLPTPTLPWASSLSISLSAPGTPAAIDFPTPSSTITTTTMVFAIVSSVLPQSQVATSSVPSPLAMSKQEWIQILKKVTKRRVKIGEQVTILQTKENLLSLTIKRKRGAKGVGMDETELVVDPLSIVKSANKMFEDAMERMQRELSQAHAKILCQASSSGEAGQHSMHRGRIQDHPWRLYKSILVAISINGRAGKLGHSRVYCWHHEEGRKSSVCERVPKPGPVETHKDSIKGGFQS